MSVNILSTSPNAASPSDIIYKVSISGFCYTPTKDSDTYTVLPSGRAHISSAPMKFNVHRAGEREYVLSKYSRVGNATLSGRFKVRVLGDVYKITRRYGSGDMAVYKLVRRGEGFEAQKARGYALGHIPGWCREREVAEAGCAFDVGLLVHEIWGNETADEWDVVGEDEGDEEFVMVERGG